MGRVEETRLEALERAREMLLLMGLRLDEVGSMPDGLSPGRG